MKDQAKLYSECLIEIGKQGIDINNPGEIVAAVIDYINANYNVLPRDINVVVDVPERYIVEDNKAVPLPYITKKTDAQ